MKRAENTPQSLDLARSLRALHREKAPASLLPAVLARVGLGDAYWKLESPIGTVYIAHSKAGISMVSRAASAREFERAFLRRHRRSVRPEKSPAPASVRALIQRPTHGQRVGLGDAYWKLESPIGTVYIAHSKAGISMVSHAASAREFERAFLRRHGRSVRPEKSPAPASVRALIQRLTRGQKADLRFDLRGVTDKADLRFDLRGVTDFERAVLNKALEIPPGEVRPYSWIAKEIGQPGAVRAAGSALAKNPIPLLIPCHRVVRSDGHIGNYAFGSRAKRAMLAVEGADPRLLEQLASEGVRYLANEAGRYYCYPTCGGIETLVRENHIRFGSAREAQAAGYKPCEDCRPAIAA